MFEIRKFIDNQKRLKRDNSKYLNLEIFVHKKYIINYLDHETGSITYVKPVRKKLNFLWWNTNREIIFEYQFITKDEVDIKQIINMGFKIRSKLIHTDDVGYKYKLYKCILKDHGRLNK